MVKSGISMFKQRIVPLISVVLLLTACATKVTTINVDVPKGEFIFSDEFAATKGETFKFKVALIDDKHFDDKDITGHLFFTDAPEGKYYMPFIDLNKTIEVIYNNKALHHFNGTPNDLMELIKTDPTKAEDQFAVGPFQTEGTKGEQTLIFCHSNQTKNDKIDFLVTSAMAYKTVTAAFLN
ncbi:MAG: hypothetical protein MJ207_02760 [Bacilli bacterium]|nr:hypothetical protein [Bacilli bacterium]